LIVEDADADPQALVNVMETGIATPISVGVPDTVRIFPTIEAVNPAGNTVPDKAIGVLPEITEV
jgi:hypothetical protein